MTYPTRIVKGFSADRPPDPHLDREWLVTNGMGGYASGTVAGPLTRRYHGLLVAALPNPLGRYMMLNAVCERMKLPDGGEFFVGPRQLTNATADAHLIAEEFRLEAGLPVWTFHTASWTLERRLRLPHGQNTVLLTYELLSGPASLQLELHFWVNFRPHDAPVSTKLSKHFALSAFERVTSCPVIRISRYCVSRCPTLPCRFGVEPRLIFYMRRNKGEATIHPVRFSVLVVSTPGSLREADNFYRLGGIVGHDASSRSRRGKSPIHAKTSGTSANGVARSARGDRSRACARGGSIRN